MLRNKHVSLRVRWMPSHLSPSAVLPRGVTHLDVKGNDSADKYAGVAANLVQVPSQVSTACIRAYSLVKNIQWRIIYIMKNLPDGEKYKSVRTPKELQSSLGQNISESKHTIHREADRLHCTVCTENFGIGDPSLVPWLPTACNSTPSTYRPTPIMNTMLHIGNQIIHLHLSQNKC